MIGPGKYDELCTKTRLETRADGVVLMVFGGEHGSGFSVQASPALTFALPGLLEQIARTMRADLEGANGKKTH